MMSTTLSEELARFADDVRTFVKAELPPETRRKTIEHRPLHKSEHVVWQQKLHKKGWAVPSWPKAYGGPGWSPLQRHVFAEVLAEQGAPDFIPFGQAMIAPVLMAFATEEQKQRYLPRIATLEDFWCQGFSEPNSGSDLASLRTKAVRDGDDWIVSGQKIWTSYAHEADMIFCLVRTDPAAKMQAGITMIVFPMNLPGITIRPTITIDGGHSVNEVFFDDVRVPFANTIGEVNKGWTYAKYLLGHERTSIARVGQSKRELARLKDIGRRQKVRGTPLIETPVFRDKVALLEIDLMALDLVNYEMLVEEENGIAPGTTPNLLKIHGAEIQQRLTELMMEAAGPQALPYPDDVLQNMETGNDPLRPDYAATLAPTYLKTRVVTIYGGSNEIQRNVIAKAELDL
jgi:alkylation response protein AidB-like acyl-CoA dehydrogenase